MPGFQWPRELVFLYILASTICGTESPHRDRKVVIGWAESSIGTTSESMKTSKRGMHAAPLPFLKDTESVSPGLESANLTSLELVTHIFMD